MKLLLTIFLASVSFFAMSQTNISCNEKAILIKNKIEKNKIDQIKITYPKRIFTFRKKYTRWSFPGGNCIEVGGRTYSLDYLKYYETWVYNATYNNEVRTLVIKFDKIR